MSRRRRPEAPWVLVSSPDQSRAGVAAVRSLAAAGYHPAATRTGRASLSAASRWCERTIVVPSAEVDPEGYAGAVREELARHPYLTVLVGSDPAAFALGRPEARYMDKVDLARRAAAADLLAPPTRTFASYAELLAARSELTYPIIVKPDVKRFIARRIDGPGDITRVPDTVGRLIVQPYLEDELHGIIGLAWHGRLVATVHFRYLRIWPRPTGTVAAAVTTTPDRDLDARLERLLADHDGPFHVDMAGPHLLDLNPRIHAALPLAIAAGADIVADYCALLEGRETRSRPGRAGVSFRWIEGDLRSLLYDVRRGRRSVREALMQARPRRGVAHSHESLRDPGPFLTRFRFLATELRVRDERRRGEARRASEARPGSAETADRPRS